MIELPEASVLARQVTETLSGKRIAHALANATPHGFAWYTGDPADYGDRLAGKTIRGASAYGSYVEIGLGDMVLAVSTPIRYHQASDPLPKKHQLMLHFEDHSAVTCTVQMWGGLFCIPAGEEGGLADYRIAKLRPSPLCETFNRQYFDSLFAAADGAISAKELLAAKQRIPGLGNGVLQDILWTARIHPKRSIGELLPTERDALYSAVKVTLAAMATQGGRDTERDLFGRAGGYKTILSKNTANTPCPACGTIICKGTYLGGTIYYCASCQPC